MWCGLQPLICIIWTECSIRNSESWWRGTMWSLTTVKTDWDDQRVSDWLRRSSASSLLLSEETQPAEGSGLHADAPTLSKNKPNRETPRKSKYSLKPPHWSQRCNMSGPVCRSHHIQRLTDRHTLHTQRVQRSRRSSVHCFDLHWTIWSRSEDLAGPQGGLGSIKN